MGLEHLEKHTYSHLHTHTWIRSVKAVMVFRDLTGVFANTASGCFVPLSIYPSSYPFIIYSYCIISILFSIFAFISSLCLACLLALPQLSFYFVKRELFSQAVYLQKTNVHIVIPKSLAMKKLQHLIRLSSLLRLCTCRWMSSSYLSLYVKQFNMFVISFRLPILC